MSFTTNFIPTSDRGVRLRGSCIQCRKRKRKCDKLRPSCSLCLHSNSPCSYDTFHEYDSNAPKKRRNRRKPDLDPPPPSSNSEQQPIQLSPPQELPPPSQPIPFPTCTTLAFPAASLCNGPSMFPPHAAMAVRSLLSPIDFVDPDDAALPHGSVSPVDPDEVASCADSESSLSSSMSSTSSISSCSSTSSSRGSVTAVSRAFSSPQYDLDSFYGANTSSPFKYLWSFYIQSTSRFCAIHDFETPFLSSVVPLACNNSALQSSLMLLSTIYRNRILGLSDDNHDGISSELSVRSMRGLRDKLSFNLTPAEALVGLATCLALTCCYIGENSSLHYNTHLYGGMMIATQVLIPDRTFFISHDAWFLFKWLTYCEILVNINLLAVPERLAQAKAHNLPAMQKLYDWWKLHALEDPEYNLPVDSFYGFGTRLAPMLLQLNILVTRDAMVSLGQPGIEPSTEAEINELEASLRLAHETSVMARYSSVCLRRTDVDLLHCDASFHGAALLYVYTYLKPNDRASQTELIPHLVMSVIAEVKSISPVCRTAAALLFVMYIAGSYAQGDQREFIYGHLKSMRTTCLSSVESVLNALPLIWGWRDEDPNVSMRECHWRVLDAGINVCVY